VADLASRKLPRLFRTLTVFGVGFAVDFGLGRARGWLGNFAEALRWSKGTGFFYAESAYRLVEQASSAFATVLYLSAVVTLVATFVRPLWQRRGSRRKKAVGWLAEAAKKHPVLADRVLPWGAGLSWLGLTFGAGIVAEFILEVLWDVANPGHATFASRAHWMLQSFQSALTRANNLGYLFGSVVAVAGIAAATRYGIRRLTRDPEAPAPVAEPIEDKSSFAAVAVTASTQGAVAGLAVLSIVVAMFAAKERSLAILSPVVFAYVLAALGTATLFRRVSRIVVGIDGILVQGADKTRFFSYAGLDGVKASGSDILLQRGGKTTLRLQLHDEDVTRAPALADRIQVAMDHAVRMRGEGADRLMQSTDGSSAAASQRLASSSRGGLDYRQPAIAREQLWQLVEGPVSDADARRVAAEALAPDMNREERQRLRVVAEKCAEPRARVALERLLEEAEDEPHEVEPAILPRRRFS
jgi:hypothetical protein